MRRRIVPFVSFSMRLLLLAALIASTAAAQTPSEPGSELTVSLITMGQGDEVWELFGHNAIWIRDAKRGTDTCRALSQRIAARPTLAAPPPPKPAAKPAAKAR